MIRLIIVIAVLVVVSLVEAWFADRPGHITLNWMGYEIETSFFIIANAIVLLIAASLIAWSVLRHLIGTPAFAYEFFKRRRQKRGLEALSSGLTAVGAGDSTSAAKYSAIAKQLLPNEPMTALLRAQSAQLTGDRATTRRIYSSMLEVPETELLGLRGLFLEAEREKEVEAARHFAERAIKLDPKLGWSVNALFDIQCRSGDWHDALNTLKIAQAQRHVDKATAKRRRAVLLTAQAVDLDESDPDEALELSLEAHKLAPDLVPAAAIAGRILAAKGNTSKAASIISKTWKLSPHPDLAVIYAFARPGDTTRDRLKRIRLLAQQKPHHVESSIALAQAAIESRDWPTAREALRRFNKNQPSARVCTLMARIEAGEYGDTGRVREWLARGLRAPRDPAWTADGHISDHWQPISPVTGELDAFEWKVPVEAMEKIDIEGQIEEFIKIEDLAANSAMLEDGAIKSKAEIKETTSAEGSDADQPPVETLPVPIDKKDDSEKPTTTDTKPEAAETGEQLAENSEVVIIEPQAAAEEETKEETVESSEEKSEQPAEKDTQKAEADSKPDTAVAAFEQSSPDAAPAPSNGEEKPKTVPETGKKKQKAKRPPRKRARRASKPKIFVPPRAPDDPGPEPLDPDEAKTPLARFRMPVAKPSGNS